MTRDNPIGIFDSGFGGLSIIKEFVAQLPNEDFIYVADTARCPYGVRPLEEIKQFVFEIIEFLVRKNVKLIAIACNTATAAGLADAKGGFSIPIIGVIKPGAETAVKTTQNNRIGVIATDATIKSKAYHKAINTIAPSAIIFGKGCQYLVELVEAGKTEGLEVEENITKCLSTLLKKDIDTLVLGCTHFPFLQNEIEKIVGKNVRVVDPAFQAVNQINNIILTKNINREEGSLCRNIYYTTGDTKTFSEIGEKLLGRPMSNVRHLHIDDLSG